MVITNGTHGLASTIVIIVLIFPEIAAHTVFLRDSAPDYKFVPNRLTSDYVHTVYWSQATILYMKK
ncbi:hypothetical protein Lal_00034355 [Lupinus albus]|nr:hypothetical protein Lal_00034355 [Lupinus albus]